MTTPTQAQGMGTIMSDKKYTAAAQVGEPITAFVERAKLSTFHATIERCAQVAEQWKSPLRPGTEARRLGHDEAAREIATAIRKLKDAPDPNLIYPGKDPDFVFPEE